MSKNIENIRVGFKGSKLILAVDLAQLETASLSSTGKSYLVATSHGWSKLTSPEFQGVSFQLNVVATPEGIQNIVKATGCKPPIGFKPEQAKKESAPKKATKQESKKETTPAPAQSAIDPNMLAQAIAQAMAQLMSKSA
ncbi:hypothetical protein E308F_29740 [Moorella sp. E308F]|uniref:hypothetical protein n=1 Tax=Moorella sp. E308F TaxID=2572682 RepID=UPI0010FFB34B|nr:hypothetical protein [Moorella sp. E308F]GEA16728.1 hypothetical protein E308F_29740 [Moorella sp. E308F]